MKEINPKAMAAFQKALNGSRKFTNNISRKVDLRKKKDSKDKESYHHHV